MKFTHLPELALLSIGLLSASAIASAQDEGGSFFSKFTYGVTAGLNMSKLGGDGGNTDAKLGGQIGGFAEYHLPANLALVTELRYIQKGGKEDDLEFELSYIELPVNLAYRLKLGEERNVSFFGGAYVAYKIDEKFSWDDLSVSGIDVTKDLDYGVNVGVGYQYNKNLSVRLQYSMGLADVSDIPDVEIKNKECISLSVGWSF